ncbi:unnamed protein product [Cyprideis torosa]|uniref:Uncharacterized protein n=1 Tax=Cyprideis torosa TaxID=163714 RepID=A0A7R8WDJ2_9CRUS|nr:unnamed protein product [Cyprideis torosa]CAG0888645.1 unnamed protein product [Cyprideis torosa]
MPFWDKLKTASNTLPGPRRSSYWRKAEQASSADPTLSLNIDSEDAVPQRETWKNLPESLCHAEQISPECPPLPWDACAPRSRLSAPSLQDCLERRAPSTCDSVDSLCADHFVNFLKNDGGLETFSFYLEAENFRHFCEKVESAVESSGGESGDHVLDCSSGSDVTLIESVPSEASLQRSTSSAPTLSSVSTIVDPLRFPSSSTVSEDHTDNEDDFSEFVSSPPQPMQGNEPLGEAKVGDEEEELAVRGVYWRYLGCPKSLLQEVMALSDSLSLVLLDRICSLEGWRTNRPWDEPHEAQGTSGCDVKTSSNRRRRKLTEIVRRLASLIAKKYFLSERTRLHLPVSSWCVIERRLADSGILEEIDDKESPARSVTMDVLPSAKLFVEAQQEIQQRLEVLYERYLNSPHFSRYQIDVLTSGNVCLNDILFDDITLFYFMEFVASDHFCQHLVEFFISCSHLVDSQLTGNVAPKDAQEDGVAMYNRYISMEAPHRIGFGDSLRSAVEGAICDPNPTPAMIQAFKKTAIIVGTVLTKEVLPAFLSSQVFHKHLSELIHAVQLSSVPVSEMPSASVDGTRSGTLDVRKRSSGDVRTRNRTRDDSIGSGSSEVTLSSRTSGGHEAFKDEGFDRRKGATPSPHPHAHQQGSFPSSLSVDSGLHNLKKAQHGRVDQWMKTALSDVDAIWRREHMGNLSLGYVDHLGRYRTAMEPDPAHVATGQPNLLGPTTTSTRIKRALKTAVGRGEPTPKEIEEAYHFAEQIISEVTRVTIPDLAFVGPPERPSVASHLPDDDFCGASVASTFSGSMRESVRDQASVASCQTPMKSSNSCNSVLSAKALLTNGLPPPTFAVCCTLAKRRESRHRLQCMGFHFLVLSSLLVLLVQAQDGLNARRPSAVDLQVEDKPRALRPRPLRHGHPFKEVQGREALDCRCLLYRLWSLRWPTATEASSSDLTEKGSCDDVRSNSQASPSVSSGRIIRVHTVTWNVKGANPPNDQKAIDKLLDLNPNPLRLLLDLVVIGIQELSIAPQNLFNDLVFEDAWSAAFRQALHPRQYVRIGRNRLQGVLLLVYAQRSLLLQITNMNSSVTRLGIANILGNKGSVSFRLYLSSVSMCFVTSHLEAHDEKLAERINGYNETVMGQTFSGTDATKILFHDYVIWLGDFNFRLHGWNSNPPFSAKDIVERISSADLATLLQRDQLTECRVDGAAFSELDEGFITFPPTYKFIPGTHTYDVRRRPAWTDRILYKMAASDLYGERLRLCLQQLYYKSIPALLISDHKPVISRFRLRVFHPHLDSPVVFDPVTSWIVGVEGSVTYHVNTTYQPQLWDWMGIFKEDFHSLDDHVYYNWCSRTPIEAGSRSYTLSFPTHFLLPGRYLALYFQAGSAAVLGMSAPFSVEHWRNARSASVERHRQAFSRRNLEERQDSFGFPPSDDEDDASILVPTNYGPLEADTPTLISPALTPTGPVFDFPTLNDERNSPATPERPVRAPEFLLRDSTNWLTEPVIPEDELGEESAGIEKELQDAMLENRNASTT